RMQRDAIVNSNAITSACCLPPIVAYLRCDSEETVMAFSSKRHCGDVVRKEESGRRRKQDRAPALDILPAGNGNAGAMTFPPLGREIFNVAPEELTQCWS